MGYEGLVGMTGFEPATTRPPDVYATGLRYIPMGTKLGISFFTYKVLGPTPVHYNALKLIQ